MRDGRSAVSKGVWWSERDRQTSDHPKRAEPSVPLAAVIKLIDELVASQPVDAGRIYLTGLSMGGYGTWDLLWREPKRFAAAIPICGAGVVEEAANIAKIPVWVFHGDKDGVIRSGSRARWWRP